MTIRHSIFIVLLIFFLITLLSNLEQAKFDLLWYSFTVPVYHLLIYGLAFGAAGTWLILSTARTQRKQSKIIAKFRNQNRPDAG